MLKQNTQSSIFSLKLDSHIPDHLPKFTQECVGKEEKES